MDITQWYHANEHLFPRVCKMWREFHARPASSAGVERLFSGAGKMHGDDAQQMKSETILNTLMCAKNYDPWAV
jgi:hypothetical protein